MKRKDIALKATWPQILAKEENYAKIAYNNMRCYLMGEDIWRCRIHPQHVKLLKIRNQFWEDVLVSWSTYNYYKEGRIENQMLWYNSRIQIKGKIIMWRDLYLRGLKYVHQLFQDKDFKPYHLLKQEYGITMLRLNSLKKALPKEWVNFFMRTAKSEFFPLPPHTFDRCKWDEKGSLTGEVYRYIAPDVMDIQYKYIKWEKELGEELCDSLPEFGKVHKDIFALTNIAKYRSFQYRLLQRGLVTNVQLEKWGITPSNSCTYCKIEKETLIHLFYECNVVRELWEEVVKYCKKEFSEQHLSLSKRNIVLNKISPKKNSVANFLCLITKQYIYSNRCLGKQIHFPVLKSRLQHIERIEKYIATKNQKINQHNRKWSRSQLSHSYEEQVDLDLNTYINQYVNSL